MAEDELFASLRLESEAYQKRNSKVFQNYEVMAFITEVIRVVPGFLVREPYFFEKKDVENLIHSLNGDHHGLVIWACWVWAKRINFFLAGGFKIEFIQKLEDKAAAGELFAIANIQNVANGLDLIEEQKFRLPVEVMEKRLKWLEGQYKDLENKEAFKTFVEQAPKLEEHIDSVKGLEAQVTKAEKTLTNQKNAFTFVGLEQGFATLSTKKENLAKEQGKLSYTLMSFILALPFLLGLVYYFTDLDWLQHLYLGLPALSLELLLLYFYRVNLQHLRSTEAQIVQLELRQALCQVIQNYTDYSSEIKAKDPSALERFEALIFSGLRMDEKNVPTSFDGLESLTNLIKSIQK
jgi:hypothetical protein